MKINILCEGRLNKGLENELCNIYINRINSLKKSGILKIEINKIHNHKNYKINKNKNIKNFILDEKGSSLNTIDFSKNTKGEVAEYGSFIFVLKIGPELIFLKVLPSSSLIANPVRLLYGTLHL